MAVSENQIEELFTAALDLAPRERERFLAENCRNDGVLRQKIESLCAADAEAAHDDFLNGAAIAHSATIFDDVFADARIGQTVGRYKILEAIGAGGMGAVYRAVRADGQFEKQVALKLIKRGMDSDAILRRFLLERQILARLEHSNIARLLDAGMTEDGLPFFVMEFVAGMPIDEFCRKREYSIEQRLELFRTICSAVNYAHQNLIVHRDLKPSNIIVNDDGTPKLLDFGIAKLLNDTEAELTQTNLRVLTPAYASPEQLRGESLTTATDVYSLGVILAELVQNPKSKVQSRNTDLKNIIEAARREDSARRYSSVEKLSDDVRRFLVGLPVAARADSFAYRAGKFVRRNKLVVAAATIVVFALCGGAAATLWEAQRADEQRVRAEIERERAERRANNLRKISNSFIVELHDEIIKLPGSLPVRQLLLQRGVEQLDALAGESDGDAALEDELAQGYSNLGEMPDLNLSEVERVRQKSVAIYQNLVAADSQNLTYRIRLAQGLVRLADSQKMRGKFSAALDYLRQSGAILESTVADAPENSQSQSALFDVYIQTASLLNSTGDARAGLDVGRRAFALTEKLVQSEPENVNYKDMLSYSRLQIAASLTALGDYQTALDEIRAARSERAARNVGNRENVAYRYEMWVTNRRLGATLAADGQIAAALDALRTALDLIEKLAAENPLDDGYRRNTSFTHLTVGQILISSNQPAKALPYLRRALALSETLIAKDPEKGETKADLAAIRSALGDALAKTGSLEEGLLDERQSLLLFAELLSQSPENVAARRGLAATAAATAENYLRSAERKNGESAAVARGEAIRLLRQSQNLWTEMREKDNLVRADVALADRTAELCKQFAATTF